MDALELLATDHDKVRGLFEDFRNAHEADDQARMRSTQESIFEELDTHAQIEEDVFYPSISDLGVEELSELVAEGVQEHHVVKVLMDEIRPLKDDDVFAAKMTVLMENVEHHADEEEADMFPLVREYLSGEQLDDLGDDLQAAKSKAAA